MVRATTSSVVRSNAKIESMNLRQMSSPANGSTIPEGYAVTYDSARKATLAGVATVLPYLVIQGNGRSDTYDLQNSPMADLDTAQGIVLETGGMTVLGGPGPIEIGLPYSLLNTSSVALASITTGDAISVASDGKLLVTAKTAIDTASFLNGAATTIGIRLAGVVSKVIGDIVWFEWFGFTVPIYGALA